MVARLAADGYLRARVSIHGALGERQGSGRRGVASARGPGIESWRRTACLGRLVPLMSSLLCDAIPLMGSGAQREDADLIPLMSSLLWDAIPLMRSGAQREDADLIFAPRDAVDDRRVRAHAHRTEKLPRARQA